ncbi:MAG: signal peptidase I [Patescibacteria group bacterium]
MPTPKNPLKLFTGWAMLWEVVKVVAISLAIIIPVRYFLLQPFYVKGASMEPNYEDHEYLLIDELSFRLREPKRGEVVVFKYPNDPSQYFIKRVIGLPGDGVDVREDGVYVNGTKLDESAYLAPSLAIGNTASTVVPSGSYFLMGDNRPASLDSRIFGPVQRNYIVGKTWIRAWPFNKLSHFSAPEYTLTSP